MSTTKVVMQIISTFVGYNVLHIEVWYWCTANVKGILCIPLQHFFRGKNTSWGAVAVQQIRDNNNNDKDDDGKETKHCTAKRKAIKMQQLMGHDRWWMVMTMATAMAMTTGMMMAMTTATTAMVMAMATVMVMVIAMEASTPTPSNGETATTSISTR